MRGVPVILRYATLVMSCAGNMVENERKAWRWVRVWKADSADNEFSKISTEGIRRHLNSLRNSGRNSGFQARQSMRTGCVNGLRVEATRLREAP